MLYNIQIYFIDVLEFCRFVFNDNLQSQAEISPACICKSDSVEGLYTILKQFQHGNRTAFIKNITGLNYG